MSESALPAKPAQADARRLRESAEVVQGLLDRLDEGAEAADAVNARRSDRYRYRVRSLGVELAHLGMGWVRYEVPSRNLSHEGAAFLLGHFVYPGTQCRIHLVSLRNQRQTVPARVVRCRYLEGSGTLHEVGVHFDRVIDVTMYNRRASRLRFLLVGGAESTRRLVELWLKTLDVGLTCVEDGCKAVEMVTTAQFDLILLDMELPDSSGIETARELRQREFARSIVMLAAEAGEGFREESLAAGCSGYLVKPISRDDLVGLIESLREKPLYSSMADDESFLELINAFVTELPERVGQLESAYSKNDLGALLNMARILKGEGGAYGFQPMTDAAARVEKAIDDAADPGELRSRLNELIRLCLSARATPCDY